MERLSTLSSHLCSNFASAESDLRHVLVVGGTGLIGKCCAEHFASQGWRVTTISRRPLPFVLTGAHSHIELDLSDRDACRAAVMALPDRVTDLVYVALGTTAKDLDQSQTSAIDVMDAVSHPCFRPLRPPSSLDDCLN